MHVAKLANLPLNENEGEKLKEQLSATIDYINHLAELDNKVKSLPPTYQVTGKENALRDDITRPGLTREEALKNARRSYNGFFVVPSVWD